MNMKKILFLTTVIFVVLFSISSICLASDFNDAISVFEGGSAEEGSIEETLIQMANIMSAVALAVSTIKLAQIGFKFMMSTGNKRSDAKQSLIPWAVGVIVCALWLVLGKWIIQLLGGDSGIADRGPFDI